MLSSLSIAQLEEITGGKAQGTRRDQLISQISIDSRQILHAEQTLFVALRGAKADGADFIPELIEEGIWVFLVHEDWKVNENWVDCATFIYTKDTRQALQHIAAFQRSNFSKPVVGITGSNGKTIIKEWLGQVLSQRFAVAKSPKSYNSQVGVPLSIFGIQAYHQVAILEAGVSKSGDMETLSQMILPDLGIFTNIGSAHEEGFSGLQEKIQEKLKLFSKSKLLVYCKDHHPLAKEIESQISSEKLISWSKKPGADFSITWKILEGKTRIVLMKSDLNIYMQREL